MTSVLTINTKPGNRKQAAWFDQFKSRVPSDPAKRVALARHIDAGLQFVESASALEIEHVAQAGTNYAMLLRELESQAVMDSILQGDPLAAAKIRGVKMKAELLAAEGGVLSAADVAQQLHISRQAVDKRRKARKLLAVSFGRRGFLYPAWQFEEVVFSQIEAVLNALEKDIGDWSLMAFFLNGNEFLNGVSPLNALRTRKVDEAVRAARAYLKHGAA